MFKPEEYPSVSPYLIVDGAGRTIEFLRRVFEAEELRRFTDEEGGILHAEVRIDDGVVMVADRTEGWPAIDGHVHIYVPNVDDVYGRALEAGAESVQKPIQKDDEDKRGGVRDAGGTTWWISTRVEA